MPLNFPVQAGVAHLSCQVFIFNARLSVDKENKSHRVRSFHVPRAPELHFRHGLIHGLRVREQARLSEDARQPPILIEAVDG